MKTNNAERKILPFVKRFFFQMRKNELVNYRHYKCIQVKMRQGISSGGLLSHTWMACA